MLRQLPENLPRPFPVPLPRRSVDAHHDLLEIVDGLEFPQNLLERRGAKLADVTGQYQRDRSFLGKFL
jgi:hypothetical protein